MPAAQSYRTLDIYGGVKSFLASKEPGRERCEAAAARARLQKLEELNKE